MIQWFRAKFAQFTDQVGDGESFEIPRPEKWARKATWVIVAGLAFGVGWACIARIDVVVQARGRLEPASASQGVQSQLGGVVTAVLVEEGQSVRRGEVLIQLDKVPLLNQLQTLVKQKDTFEKRIATFQAVRQGGAANIENLAGLNIPPELLSQLRDRNLLVAQLTGNPVGLGPAQMRRYELFVQQIRDLQAVNELATSAIGVQLAGANAAIRERQTQLEIEQTLVANLEPLVQQGAISRTDYLRRVVGLNQIQDQLNQSLVQGQQSVIGQVQSQVSGRNQVADLYRQAEAQLAELDARVNEIIAQDKSQLLQVDSQITEVQNNLARQDVRSPVNGIVFDLSTRMPGLVTQPGQVLMQVTPDEGLVARLEVPNAEIGRLKVGMDVDLRIDAYPFFDFGSVPGVITQISSDALAQDEPQSFYMVEVRLTRLNLNDQEARLTPGMALTGNIIVGERPPIAYLSEQITTLLEGFKTVQ